MFYVSLIAEKYPVHFITVNMRITMKKAFFQISGIVAFVALLLGTFSTDALAYRRHHRHYYRDHGHYNRHHHYYSGHRR